MTDGISYDETSNTRTSTIRQSGDENTCNLASPLLFLGFQTFSPLRPKERPFTSTGHRIANAHQTPAVTANAASLRPFSPSPPQTLPQNFAASRDAPSSTQLLCVDVAICQRACYSLSGCDIAHGATGRDSSHTGSSHPIVLSCSAHSYALSVNEVACK
eukprot:3940731-Rhodomonas_salina.4